MADDLLEVLARRHAAAQFRDSIQRTAVEHAPDMTRAPRPQARASSKPVLSPKMALVLGSLADSASTYAFLKRGTRREANPVLGVFNRHPWTVFPVAAAGAYGYSTLYDALKKKMPRVADTIAGGLGGYHAALAGSNMMDDAEDSFTLAARRLRPTPKGE